MASGKAEEEKEKAEVGGRKAEVELQPPEGAVAEQVPEYLVYEWVKGQPIYYKGYKEVLTGHKTLEEVMSESILQSFLKIHFGAWLIRQLQGRYLVLGGELGLQLGYKHSRAADLAIFKAGTINMFNPHYADKAPHVILEIDTQADLEDNRPMAYISAKIEDYHQFGVERVLWIMTQPRKIIFALPNRPWLTYNWTDEVEIVEGLSVVLEEWIQEQAQLQGQSDE